MKSFIFTISLGLKIIVKNLEYLEAFEKTNSYMKKRSNINEDIITMKEQVEL